MKCYLTDNGIVPLLNRGIEGVHIDMNDLARGRHLAPFDSARAGVAARILRVGH